MGWTEQPKSFYSEHEQTLKIVGGLGVGIIAGVLIREYAPRIGQKYGISNLQDRLLNKVPYAKKEDIDARIDALSKRMDDYMHGAAQ